MKRLTLHAAASGLRAAICIASAAPAFAADLPARTYTKAPSQTPPDVVYDWTGFYVGGNVGGALAGPDSLERNNGRFVGGAQFGFDRQIASNWVAGSEVQIDGFVGNSGHGVLFPGGTLVATDKANLLASFTGRVGYTWGPALLYAKAGSALRDNANINASAGGVPVATAIDGHRHLGITAGGGVEYMLAPNWSAKAEYQYYTFGDSHFTDGPGALVGSRFRNDEHTVRLGVNYRFRGS